jgi:hypothetical protein
MSAPVHSAEDLANDGLFDDSELKESPPTWPQWGWPTWGSTQGHCGHGCHLADENALPPALLREPLTVLVGDAYRTSVRGSGKPNFV